MSSVGAAALSTLALALASTSATHPAAVPLSPHAHGAHGNGSKRNGLLTPRSNAHRSRTYYEGRIAADQTRHAHAAQNGSLERISTRRAHAAHNGSFEHVSTRTARNQSARAQQLNASTSTALEMSALLADVHMLDTSHASPQKGHKSKRASQSSSPDTLTPATNASRDHGTGNSNRRPTQLPLGSATYSHTQDTGSASLARSHPSRQQVSSRSTSLTGVHSSSLAHHSHQSTHETSLMPKSRRKRVRGSSLAHPYHPSTHNISLPSRSRSEPRAAPSKAQGRNASTAARQAAHSATADGGAPKLLLPWLFPGLQHVYSKGRPQVDRPLHVAIMMTEQIPTLSIAAALVLCTVLGLWCEAGCGGESSPPFGHRVAAANVHAARRKADADLVVSKRSLLRRLCDFWSGAELDAPRAVVSLKMYMLCLLCIELLVLTLPLTSVLTAPEMVRYIHGHRVSYPRTRSWRLLLPHLDETSIDAWAQRLSWLRCVLLSSFGAWLLAPSPWRWAQLCFCVGALSYVYMAVLSVGFQPTHTVQTSILFLSIATLASAPSKKDPFAFTWLRSVMLYAVLLPSYLCAGLSKLRYTGLASQFTGVWLIHILKEAQEWPTRGELMLPDWLRRYVLSRALAQPFFLRLLSWGNALLELILPVALLLHSRKGPSFEGLLLCFTLVAFGFHVTIWLLLGRHPNFVRQIPQLAFVFLPSVSRLRCYDGGTKATGDSPSNAPPLLAGAWNTAREASSSANEAVDFTEHEQYCGREPCVRPRQHYSWWHSFRCILSACLLLAWFYPQLASDFLHLTGVLHPDERYDFYLPIPEQSMYASPQLKLHNYEASLVVDVLLVLALLWRMMQ